MVRFNVLSFVGSLERPERSSLTEGLKDVCCSTSTRTALPGRTVQKPVALGRPDARLLMPRSRCRSALHKDHRSGVGPRVGPPPVSAALVGEKWQVRRRGAARQPPLRSERQVRRSMYAAPQGPYGARSLSAELLLLRLAMAASLDRPGPRPEPEQGSLDASRRSGAVHDVVMGRGTRDPDVKSMRSAMPRGGLIWEWRAM